MILNIGKIIHQFACRPLPCQTRRAHIIKLATWTNLFSTFQNIILYINVRYMYIFFIFYGLFLDYFVFSFNLFRFSIQKFKSLRPVPALVECFECSTYHMKFYYYIHAIYIHCAWCVPRQHQQRLAVAVAVETIKPTTNILTVNSNFNYFIRSKSRDEKLETFNFKVMKPN